MLFDLQQGLELYYHWRQMARRSYPRTAVGRKAATGIRFHVFKFFEGTAPSMTPSLAIFALPHACTPNCDTAITKAFEASNSSQVNAFEAGNRLARALCGCRMPTITSFGLTKPK